MGKSQREQVGVPEHETQTDGLPGQFPDTGTSTPADWIVDRIAENLGTVSQCKSLEGLSLAVLDLHALKDYLADDQIEKVIFSCCPVKTSGLVNSSPPSSGAATDANPSIRIV